jgi:hypothetical protein
MMGIAEGLDFDLGPAADDAANALSVVAKQEPLGEDLLVPGLKVGLGAFQNAFGAEAAAAAGDNPQLKARVVIATYQTLDVDSDDADADFLERNYPPDYFSHIVIDECHRSAWGKWSKVLTRNPDAVQIGLTAAPRQVVYPETGEAWADEAVSADNLRHFGDRGNLRVPALDVDLH